MSSKKSLSVLISKAISIGRTCANIYKRFVIMDDPVRFLQSFRKHYEVVSLGNISAVNNVPEHIAKPYYVSEKLKMSPSHPILKTSEEIDIMKSTCRLAKTILDSAGVFVKAGITTNELDKSIHDLIIKNSAYPSPLMYEEFPKSICTSVNNIVCHGIPDDRRLRNGDIITVDITVFRDGFHGDCAATFLVGSVDQAASKLVRVTEDILYKAVNICRPGLPIIALAHLISHEAEKHDYFVIPSVCGHGIGRNFHEFPEIIHNFNYAEDEETVMLPGMTFTIEPAISEGTESVCLLNDQWTLATDDDSLCAQFEHTVLITNTGVEVLTK